MTGRSAAPPAEPSEVRVAEGIDANAYAALDLLATMVAVVGPDGHLLYVNAMLETVAGLSRRTLMRGSLLEWFADPQPMRDTLAAVVRNEVSTARFDALMKRAPVAAHELLPVHVIVTQIDHRADRVVVEMLEIEQQTRQDREERALGQVQVTKELIRNLAHEIKNPLGGIRGAAQLLEMELSSRELTEYTQVIIHEADRLQALVDRLLAPHRRPHVVSDVNVHEVCERVRALILAEFPRGLKVQRDYDTSLPEFRAEKEQLIQAVLNIAHNAAQALADRREAVDAAIVLRTRAARQVTIRKQRFKLGLEVHIEENAPGTTVEIQDRILYPLAAGREGGPGQSEYRTSTTSPSKMQGDSTITASLSLLSLIAWYQSKGYYPVFRTNKEHTI